MTKLLDLLQAAPLFQVESGKTIIKEERPVKRMFILREGAVMITKKRTPISEVSESGTVFGEVSALLDGKATASVVTLKTCTFHIIDDPVDFFLKNNGALLEIATILARRLDAVTRSYVEELDDNNTSYWRHWV